MTKATFRGLLLTASVLTLMTAGSAAFAGFEWKGPAEKPIAAPAAAPVDPLGDMAPITSNAPDILWTETQMPVENVAPVESAPAAQPSLMVTSEPAPQMEAFAPAVAAGEDVLNGFGSEMPLVMALQQIVPPGYSYSFSSGVNPGTAITWEGGKPWKDVLTEALSARGLAYQLSNNSVVVMAQGSVAGMVSTLAPSETAAAPIISEPSKADSIPADMVAPAPVSISTPPAASMETVEIRREKPTDLLSRLREKMAKKETAPKEEVTETVSVPVEEVKEETPAPAPEMKTEPQLSAEPLNKLSAEPMGKISAEPTSIVAPPPSVLKPPAEASVKVSPQMVEPSWHGAKGETLRAVLKAWSDVAGIELYWSIDYDYRLSEDAAFGGNYDEAVGRLLDRFTEARPQPYGQLHQPEGAPRVLVVKSYDLK